MRRIITGGLVALVGLFVLAKVTTLGSYVGTLWCQAKQEAQRQVPTKFELERVRHEIANLDQDIDRMVRPIAEYKVAIDRLRQEVSGDETALEGKRKSLLTLTEGLKNGPQFITVDGKRYKSDEAKQILHREFQTFKKFEDTVSAKRRVLEAKEQSLKGTQEQLAKVISQKREFELRVTELEAQFEAQQVSKIGTNIKLDTTRATQIANDLRGIEDRLKADLEEGKLRGNGLINETNAQPQGEVDVESIRAHLEGAEATTKTVQKQ